MKFGMRTPSPKRTLAARTSPARFVRHNLGLKAPRGWGWLTNPRPRSLQAGLFTHDLQLLGAAASAV